MISFVMPYYNRWDLCHARLAELYRYLFGKYEFEIIMVNDASTEADCETGVKFWQGVFNAEGKKILRYYRSPMNFGFGGSMNSGMFLSKGEFICLYSNDVICTGDFLQETLEKLKSDRILIGGEIIDRPAGWNEFSIGDRKVYIPYVNGWFLAFNRSLYDEGVEFDPLYGKFDFEDVDLSIQALEVGYNLLGLNSPYLKHIGGATIWKLHADRQQITEKNRKLFISKWQDKILRIGTQYNG